MQGSNSVGSMLAYLAMGALALLQADLAIAQEAAYDPAAVKAAFIYHFSTFVTWPEQGIEGQPFVIAVLGDEDVARQLERYLPGRRIMGRPMEAVRVESADDIGHAEVLFIGSERADDLEETVEAVRGKPVLVVSDTPEGLDKGAMINFLIVERHVRFEISLPAAEQAGLALSSRLLAAARQVRTTDILMERLSPLDGWAHEKGVRALFAPKRALTPFQPFSPTPSSGSVNHRHADGQPQCHDPSEQLQECLQLWEDFPMVSWPFSAELSLEVLRIGRILTGDFGGIEIGVALAVPAGEAIVGMHDLG